MKNTYLILICLVSWVTLGQKQNFSQIEVKGEGIVQTIPDGIILSLSTETEGITPLEAKMSNDKAMQKIFNFLKLKNIPENAITTNYISLNKNYFDEKQKNFYKAYQRFTVILNNIKTYDEIIIGLLSQGTTNIENINFSFKNIQKYKEIARSNAIKNAYEKALQYAKECGVTLEKVLLIQEEPSYNYTQPEMLQMAKSVGNSTISVGEHAISESVKVIFEILSEEKNK